jgi:hypothetical protein
MLTSIDYVIKMDHKSLRKGVFEHGVDEQKLQSFEANIRLLTASRKSNMVIETDILFVCLKNQKFEQL